MTVAHKLAFLTAILLVYFVFAPSEAEAQFVPFGGGGGNMMSQMAPMLEMMKAKMGKRRFARLMQTLGPMMARMMGSGPGGMPGIGGSDDGGGVIPGVDVAGGQVMGIVGGNGGDMTNMIPQLVASVAPGGRHRRRRP